MRTRGPGNAEPRVEPNRLGLWSVFLEKRIQCHDGHSNDLPRMLDVQSGIIKVIDFTEVILL